MLEFRASDLTALSSLTEEPGEPFANRARFIIIKNNYFLIILIFDYTFQLCCYMWQIAFHCAHFATMAVRLTGNRVDNLNAPLVPAKLEALSSTEHQIYFSYWYWSIGIESLTWPTAVIGGKRLLAGHCLPLDNWPMHYQYWHAHRPWFTQATIFVHLRSMASDHCAMVAHKPTLVICRSANYGQIIKV